MGPMIAYVEANGEVSEKRVYKVCIRVKCKQSHEMEQS